MRKDQLDFSEIRQGQTRTMFSILKLLSLFFAAIPLFHYLSKNIDIDGMMINKYLYSIGFTLIIICVLMLFIMFIFSRNENNTYLQVFEIFIYLVIFTLSVSFSGAQESYNKFLFLFLIIFYTIEHGMKVGLTIATISTLIIMAIDFSFGQVQSVNQYFENDIALFFMFYVTAMTLGFYVRLEKLHIRHLTECANMDDLTGAYNHRHFYELISSIWKNSVKNKEFLSLLMIDIDNFKKYNDTFGHKQGDKLLVSISEIIKKNLRPDDIFCRYGGDEFSVILPNTDKETATELANTLRDAVVNMFTEENNVVIDKGNNISIGVSTTNGEIEDYNSLIEHADMALYRAKFLKRNKVEVYSSIFEDLKDLNNNNENILENIKSLKALITVINSRDSYTYNHVNRVFNYCVLIADSFKLSSSDKKLLLYAAYLHDLGKINVSKDILIHDNKLSDEEWELLKKHPKESADIISQIEGFDEVVPIVLQHHERYDGTGYPLGLKGEEIHYLARILTVVDSFDAMTNFRPYQRTKTFKEALVEIEENKGSQFDPHIADIFIRTMLEM